MTDKRIVITADRIGTLEQIDYRITRVEATRKKDLPDEYLYGFPCTYMVDNTLFVATIYKLTAVRTGEFMSVRSFRRLIRAAKRSGNRLHRIRKRIKKQNARTPAKFSITI